MTTYTARYNTEADWAEHKIEAATPAQALEQARQYAPKAIWELTFEAYDRTSDIEHIEILDPSDGAVAEWHSPDLLVRLAAPELLAVLEMALAALNNAVRCPVPELDTDSYAIASLCHRTIVKAKGGAA